MSAEGTNRPAKRDIDIDNDEAKREQPAEKIVKKETEPVSSANVAHLQQQLIKSDEKFKRMCEMAGEYKARVEFLENIIDNKEGIIGNAKREESTDELRKRVAELTKQLEEREARERMEQPQQSIAVIQPPPDDKPNIKGAGDPYNILQLYNSDLPCSMPFDIARDILHALYAKCSLHSLIKSCDTIKSETNNCDSCSKEFIGVTKMFHHLFSKEHAEKMFGRSVSEAAVNYWKDKLEQSTTIAPIDNICHPSILQSCDSTTPESISYFGARRTLHHFISKCDMESLLALCANEFFDCHDCGENNLDANQVFVHFLSTEHAKKMSERHLSLAAMSYWKDKLIQAESKVIIHNVCNPTNIFQLCRSDAPSTVTIDCARELFKDCLTSRRDGLGHYVKAMASDRLYCEVCKTNPRMPGGIKHLFNSEHIEKANAVGADSISLTAVNYWAQLSSQREEAAAYSAVRLLKKKDQNGKEAAAAARAAAAAVAAKKAAAEAQKHLVQPDPAVAAATVEVKKEAKKEMKSAKKDAAEAEKEALRMAAINRLVQHD